MKGRKRHLLVDTSRFVLKAKVLAANTADQEGAKQLLNNIQSQFPRSQHLWIDGGYRSTFIAWVKKQMGWTVQRVQHLNAGSRRRITMPGVEPAPIVICAVPKASQFQGGSVGSWNELLDG